MAKRTANKKDAAIQEAIEVLNLSDPDFRREAIRAPEDPMILELCERIGYGAVMDSAARQWRLKDPVGAHTCGAAVGTLKLCLKQLKAAR
jgi:hypothetical protein